MEMNGSLCGALFTKSIYTQKNSFQFNKSITNCLTASHTFTYREHAHVNLIWWMHPIQIETIDFQLNVASINNKCNVFNWNMHQCDCPITKKRLKQTTAKVIEICSSFCWQNVWIIEMSYICNSCLQSPIEIVVFFLFFFELIIGNRFINEMSLIRSR